MGTLNVESLRDSYIFTVLEKHTPIISF